MNSQDVSYFSEIKKLGYRDLLIFLIPFVIFFIYLMVFNPGIATWDTFNQFHQIASGQFTNWHPFFHTFIEMICLSIFPNPMSIGMLQILVFSIMWMAICRYFRDDSSPSNTGFLLQLIVTLIVCLIPINALYSITYWKDILFSYFLMFLCFLAKVLIDKQGKVDLKFIILISLIMACLAQLRGNGFYVVVISMIIYAFYLYKKNNVEMAKLLPVLTIVFIVLIVALNFAYNVQDNEKDIVMTKTAHMLADYDMNLSLDSSDRDKIHELVNPKKMEEQYSLSCSDGIYGISNQSAFDSNKGTYISMALKYSLSNPLHFLKYLFGSSVVVWDVTRDDAWIGHPYHISEKYDIDNRSAANYHKNRNITPSEGYENISFVNWGNPVFKAFNSFAIFIENNPILDSLFNSPALYMYLSIIILVAIHLITKSKEIYLMYIPNILNILAIFASTPIQDARYLYPNMLICYMLIIILIGIWKSSTVKLKK